jgi:hypothetical protein
MIGTLVENNHRSMNPTIRGQVRRTFPSQGLVHVSLQVFQKTEEAAHILHSLFWYGFLSLLFLFA